MDVYDRRQDALRQLMRARFENSQTALAEAIGRSDNYISRVMSRGPNRKRIGEKLARQIESMLRLSPGALDGSPALRVAEPSAVYGKPISPEEAHAGREWGKLDEPVRGQILELIESLVGTQIREKRAAKRQPDRQSAQ